MVNPGLPGTLFRVGPSSMGITLPITIGLPMGVTWPVTPPMTSFHVVGGEGRKGAEDDTDPQSRSCLGARSPSTEEPSQRQHSSTS